LPVSRRLDGKTQKFRAMKPNANFLVPKYKPVVDFGHCLLRLDALAET
jgi:hypothetical protein